MRRLLLPALLLAAACRGRSGPEQEPRHERKPIRAEDVAKKAREAFETTRDFLIQEGEKLRGRIDAWLEDIEPQIEELRRSSGQWSEKARKKAGELLEKLEGEAEEVRRELRKVKDERGEDWDRLRERLARTLAALEERIDDLRRGLGEAPAVAAPSATP